MCEPSDSPKSDGPDSPPLKPANFLCFRSHSHRNRIAELRKDLDEFGESLNSTLAGISNPGQGEEDDDDGLGSYVPGINSDVLGFVEHIAMAPNCWTEFPVAVDDDFEMSANQQKHVVAIEELVPSLGNLRVELESSISQEQFWRMYFTMLLSKLDKHDFELLSTPKITEVREAIVMQLQKIEREKLDKSKKPEDGTETTQGENGSSEVANAGKGKEAEDDVNNLNTHSIVAGQRIVVHDYYFSVGPVQGAGASSSSSASAGGSKDLYVTEEMIKAASEWVEVPKGGFQ